MPQVLKRHTLLLMIVLFAAVGLACAQSGDIISDAEATQRALPTTTPVLDLSAEAKFQIGETVATFGDEFGALVPLYGEPGGRFFSSQVITNSPVTIIQLGLDSEGAIWYQVEGNAGTGWIQDKNLVPLEEE